MTATYAKVAVVSEFATRNYRIIQFMGKEVAIFKIGDEFFAVNNLCPHRQAPLSAGEIKDFVVTCPWHQARFDLRTGKGLPGPHQADIGCYRTEVKAGAVYFVL